MPKGSCVSHARSQCYLEAVHRPNNQALLHASEERRLPSAASESISAHKTSKQKRKEAEERLSGLPEASAQRETQTEADKEQRLSVEQLKQEWRLDEVQDEMH
ncbi:predicted protein [Aspergillus nidulans FGSC A4]|uniref:Uncharacterized protein n=1 Tax=Emericella nidulans (strain FGSC A4 / ATCC 38163 / CBS 112.46 / NRRL 194 / M139) TaxID=227321 RepID=Q5AZ74_EMENI|nr:hypothetical protein [Aspergillus nidulans FGSC A4]EAA58428.1 predicted protein [Aspergillus nidulans FGSC A4]CBF69533.1 TPA: conserved hypothetical protein [Aspergillus nidulans FGSC A4]|eukprot:XP_664010.1 predicted protein [Aspergillus nidulans FGSC A4]